LILGRTSWQQECVVEEAVHFMAEKKQRKKKGLGTRYAPGGLLPPARPCLLKFPASSPNSVTRQGPNIQHMNLTAHVSGA
jgi:hypothetical protein